MKRKDEKRIPESAYCAAEVRRNDPDRYIAALFAPPPAREHLFALYAFGHEVAKVRETVSEPMLGEIRLQWWRETIEGFPGGEPRRHPVADALNRTVREARLPKAGLRSLIDARSADLALEEAPLPDEAALMAYADETASRLIELAYHIEHGAPPDAAAAEAVRAGGRAWACTGLLRALPYHARDRRIFIPRSILQTSNVDPESVFAGRHTPELAHAMADMAALARENLAKVRVVPAARGAPFLYLSLCDLYLAQIVKPDFNPFTAPVQVSDLRRLLRMWGRALRRTI